MLTGSLLVKVEGGSNWDNDGTNKVIRQLELAASHALRKGEPEDNSKVEMTVSDTVTWKLCAFAGTEIFEDQELKCGTAWGLKISKS